MGIWEADKLLLFVGFVIPGFVALKVYELFIPGPAKDSSKQLVDAVAYSCINYALLLAPILWVEKGNLYGSHPAFYAAFYVFVLLIAPVLWVFLWRFVRMQQLFQDSAPHPMQKPWDFVFSQRKRYWMRVTLKDGTKIGGRYAEHSFSSSAPTEEQIYLEETWLLNENGEFERPKNQSAGVLIMPGEIAYVELMDYFGDGDNEQQQTDA